MVNIRAARVGIHTLPDYRVPCVVVCERCGRQRSARRDRPPPPLCQDCKSVDPLFGKTPKEFEHAV